MDKSKKRVEQDYARNAEADGNTSAGRYEAEKAVELAAGGPTMKGSTSNIHMESNSQEKSNLLNDNPLAEHASGSFISKHMK